MNEKFDYSFTRNRLKMLMNVTWANLPLSLSQMASLKYASSISVIAPASMTFGITFKQLKIPFSGNFSSVQS